MTFYEVLEQVIALLQRYGRVTYRALKRHFDLDDDYLDDLKAELIDARQLAPSRRCASSGASREDLRQAAGRVRCTSSTSATSRSS